MQKFTIISHTADTGIEVKANTLEELFENAALGMFSIIADLTQIKAKERLEIEVKAEDLNELFLNWLRELLYQFNTSYILFKEFMIRKLNDKRLIAYVWGDKIGTKKGIINTEIKAVTYHEFKLEKKDSCWKAQVIFDV
ncbi:MAG: archease [Candidatus Omnitrophota bacterium]|nr:archease [Candidatus Omnitrophota bacterium]